MAQRLSSVIRRVIIPAAMCAFSCTAPVFAQNAPASEKPADYDDADGYAVLAFFLEHYRPELGNTLEIASLTASGAKPDSFAACGSKIPAEFATAANDFKDKNKQNWRVTKKLNLKFSYKLVDLAKKHQPLAPTGNAKELPPPVFDHAVYQVSAVGFDASRTHAIVYVAAVCGPDCTSGGYHLLTKEKGGWKEYVSSPVCESMSSFHVDSFSERSPS
ncbi:MAG: hypothetical protein WB607_28680 [Candidatus Acidiferrum sp.]